MTVLTPSFVPEDVALVRDHIRQQYGFLPPDAFVTDLIRFVDGKSVPGWSSGRSGTFWQTIGARYQFNPPAAYISALRAFVDELEAQWTGEE